MQKLKDNKHCTPNNEPSTTDLYYMIGEQKQRIDTMYMEINILQRSISRLGDNSGLVALAGWKEIENISEKINYDLPSNEFIDRIRKEIYPESER